MYIHATLLGLGLLKFGLELGLGQGLGLELKHDVTTLLLWAPITTLVAARCRNACLLEASN